MYHTVINLVQIFSNFYQHIVFDTLPKVQYICNSHVYASDEVRILVANRLQRSLALRVCNMAPESRYIVGGTSRIALSNAVHANVVHVPYVPHAMMGIHPPNSLRPLTSRKVLCNHPLDLVYLSRRRKDVGHRRIVLDEHELLATISAAWSAPHRVRVIKSSNWLKDQVLMRNAAIVVAPHGGAISNIVFAPVGATLIELVSDQGLRQRPCYYGLARALDFQYEHVEPNVFGFDIPMQMGQRGREHVGHIIRATETKLHECRANSIV